MPADASPTLSRRAFLTSSMSRPEPEFRPPWTDEARVQQHCTGCSACVDSCPETIIEFDSRNRPRVNFGGRECTFCGECARACPEPVFDTEQDVPWPVTVAIGANCLLAAGITCQLCTDICDTRALRMDLSVRPAGAIRADTDACTGCGACLAPCPVSAISLNDNRLQKESA